MSTIFNRKDASVIEFALNNSLEAFIDQYSGTSANKNTLTKAYNEIVGNKTKSNIAVRSGDGNPNEPLAPVKEKPQVYALDEDGEIKKVDTTNIPTRTDLDDAEFENGKVVKKGGKPVEKKKATAKKSSTKSTASKSTKQSAIKKATLADGTQATGSKRDVIRELLQGNPEMSNKQIKEEILSRGFKSCYDSEISAVKNK